jgi:hypothetical protein
LNTPEGRLSAVEASCWHERQLRLILSEGDEDVPPDGVVCLQVDEIAAIAKEFGSEIR